MRLDWTVEVQTFCLTWNIINTAEFFHHFLPLCIHSVSFPASVSLCPRTNLLQTTGFTTKTHNTRLTLLYIPEWNSGENNTKRLTQTPFKYTRRPGWLSWQALGLLIVVPSSSPCSGIFFFPGTIIPKKHSWVHPDSKNSYQRYPGR